MFKFLFILEKYLNLIINKNAFNITDRGES